MVTLVSKAWGIPPCEVRRLGALRQITMRDALALVGLELSDPWRGASVFQYLMPDLCEREERRRKERQDEYNRLVAYLKMLNTTKPMSAEHAASLEQQKKEVILRVQNL